MKYIGMNTENYIICKNVQLLWNAEEIAHMQFWQSNRNETRKKNHLLSTILILTSVGVQSCQFWVWLFILQIRLIHF